MSSYFNQKIDRCDSFAANVEKLLRLLTEAEKAPVFVMSIEDIVSVASSEHFDLAYRALGWLCKFVNATCLHSGDVRISLYSDAECGAIGKSYRFIADCDDHIVTSKFRFGV